MATARPFPIVRGGCSCSLIRYQIETAPLFVYACHCSECQRASGSVFAVNAVIEFDRVRCISPTQPEIIVNEDHVYRPTTAICPKCKNALWSKGGSLESTLNVHVGTLDLPSLMEPDLHTFIEGKVYWLALPEGTKTVKGHMDHEKVWPKSSLGRLEACVKRWDALQGKGKEVEVKAVEKGKVTTVETVVQAENVKGKDVEKERSDEVEKEEEKTPTNGSPEPRLEDEDEDDDDDDDDENADLDGITDEEYERRHNEKEKELNARLEELTMKLSEYQ